MEEKTDEQLNFILIQSLLISERLSASLNRISKKGDSIYLYTTLMESSSHLETLGAYLRSLIDEYFDTTK